MEWKGGTRLALLTGISGPDEVHPLRQGCREISDDVVGVG